MGKKKDPKAGIPDARDIMGPSGEKPKRDIKTRPGPEDIEREVRRYVKRDGGFRKNLSEKDRKHCEDLCKKYKRPAEWTKALPM